MDHSMRRRRACRRGRHLVSFPHLLPDARRLEIRSVVAAVMDAP